MKSFIDFLFPHFFLAEIEYIALSEILAWSQPHIMTNMINFVFGISWTPYKLLNIIFPGCAFSWLILFASVAGRLLVPTLEFWRNQVAVYDAVCKFFSFMHNCLALNCTCLCTFKFPITSGWLHNLVCHSTLSLIFNIFVFNSYVMFEFFVVAIYVPVLLFKRQRTKHDELSHYMSCNWNVIYICKCRCFFEFHFNWHFLLS